MNIQTDYIKLMHTKSKVGQEPTRFYMYRNGEKPELLDDERLSLLFVLQGQLVCMFNNSYSVKLNTSQMMVIDTLQVQSLQCVGDTVIFEWIESDEMSALMQTTSKTFSMPCSEIIPLNGQLDTWCRNMFIDLTENPSRDNNYYHTRCRELVTLLLEYPKNMLGTLYIPLYACFTHCNKCSKLFAQKEK